MHVEEGIWRLCDCVDKVGQPLYVCLWFFILVSALFAYLHLIHVYNSLIKFIIQGAAEIEVL